MATKKQPTVQAGIKRIFWKEDEKQTVVNAVALALHKGEHKSATQAINAVQHLLPEDRRRPHIHSVGPESMPWFRPMLDKALDKLKKAEAKARAAAEAEAKAAEAQAAAAAEAAAAEAAAEADRAKLREELAPDFAARDIATATQALNGVNGHHHPVAATPVVRTELVAAAGIGHAILNLRAMLVDQLASVFVEAAVKAMGSMGAPQPQAVFQASASPSVEPAAPAWDKPKPSVLVVGLAGQQHIEVEKRFARMLDLRFVGRDESKDKLRDESDKAQVAIVMTDRVSPSQFDIVKARAPNIVPQPGGLQQLHGTLADMVSNAAANTTH